MYEQLDGKIVMSSWTCLYTRSSYEASLEHTCSQIWNKMFISDFERVRETFRKPWSIKYKDILLWVFTWLQLKRAFPYIEGGGKDIQTKLLNLYK